VKRVDLVPVQVEVHVVAERHHRPRGLGARRHGPVEQPAELLGAHPRAHVVVRHDPRAGLAEILVAAGVIAVPVGVDHEPHRLIGDLTERGEDPVGERRVLIVHQNHAVLAHRDADVPARALEHVDPVGELGALDLDLGEIGLGECGRGERERGGGAEQSGEKACGKAHGDLAGW
jgi:hypothetical protein